MENVYTKIHFQFLTYTLRENTKLGVRQNVLQQVQLQVPVPSVQVHSLNEIQVALFYDIAFF